jgi:MFS family permease
MATLPPRPGHGRRALDLLNFFLANVQTGFGPFVAVYLTSQKWTEGEIGLVLSIGTVVGVMSQLPAGALVDAAASKRAAAAAAIGGVIAAALLLAIWPIALSVVAAEVIHGLASSMLTPAVAALSLGLVGRAALGERLGRNAAFGALGNGLAAAAMGAAGSVLGTGSVFWLTAALGLPALAALAAMGPPGRVATAPRGAERFDRRALASLAADRRLRVFAGATVLLFLSNGALLPLAASLVTRQAGASASLLIAAAIVLPQAVVAVASGAVGRQAERRGRRPVLLLGWAMQPVPALLLLAVPGPGALLAGQALGGITAAVVGVMLPLIAADISRERGHFNLCIGVFGLCAAAGAALSTALAGEVADSAGNPAAFLFLAVAGLAGLTLIGLAMPETRELLPVPAASPAAAR